MLKSLTGQNAHQHIHDRLIEKAKEILSTTRLTIAEIAYHLVLNTRSLLINYLSATPVFHQPFLESRLTKHQPEGWCNIEILSSKSLFFYIKDRRFILPPWIFYSYKQNQHSRQIP